jgi:asparagine synthase (glutamine-hydrolysing)
MCGIAGGTGTDSAERRSVLERQLATLTNRGPDSAGYLPGDGAVVGQTRLAVIDVAHGDPPLTDESGDVRVALNGEIYNFRTLQDELRGGGHRLATGCDTEVVAHLAEDHEPVALARRLHGMFAFAVWDARRGRLVLGRDRLGKKPLHYWTDGRDLVFGSEIKAVLADPRVPRRVDVTVLPAYLALGYVPTPRTFFEGVLALPPGCVLTFEPGRPPVVERYWDAPARASEDLLAAPRAELAERLLALLRQAVRDRLVADVPLGAFLSGGVDSSAVVALMAEASSGPVRTFCIGFEEEAYDERVHARAVADRFGCEHTELVVRPDAADLLDRVLDACDQPFADSSALPTYLLAEMTRRHVTVALSGDGGDELFAGYERFAAGVALSRLSRLPTAPLRGLASVASAVPVPDQRSARAKAVRFLQQAPAGMPAAYLGWVSFFDRRWLDRLLPAGSAAVEPSYGDIWVGSAGAPVLNRLLDLNRRTYLLDDLLVKSDRMSMAHGLEVRSPLLDHRLVEFAVQVPPDEQLRGRQLKLLLKSAVAGIVPTEVLDRPKKGFGVPLDAWFRGELLGLVHERLVGPASRLPAVLDPTGVRALVDEHLAGRAAHGQRLWSLLVLERFLAREGL